MSRKSAIRKTLSCLFIAAFPLIGFIPSASAHPLSASYTDIHFKEDETDFSFSIDELSLIENVAVDGNNNGKLEQAELAENEISIIHLIEDSIVFEVDNRQQAPLSESVAFEDRNGTVFLTFQFIFPPVSYGQTVRLNDGLYYNDSNTAYTNFVVATNGEDITQAILKGSDRDWTMLLAEPQLEQGQASESNAAQQKELTEQNAASASAPASPAAGKTEGSSPGTSQSAWASFFKLGMEHILGGFDHLLFLLALLLGKQSYKQYAATITAFTIAHSITLTLTFLDIIHLPVKFIEAAIAFSIIYVAIENIIFKKIRFRWLITFAFGLIHGMGFADILLGMNIPAKYIAIDLASFNIGIEVIQLLLVAATIPILRYSQKFKGYFRTAQAASVLIAAAGAFWLIERLSS
ncbi:HupE/UreJ family protein [Paenibacillus sp. NEAU-GSW1]|uniref:HupE/UreJ family protein n=1 Tax=Paenibacillus sp. NEAU-GSW1 TaxID=2682486 RepID=UPI0012E319E8|nr:HupE/UreJ family protein [Paenibacillus sp. NEAU-GSW1]MUT65822.1 HupE/UreJ family protein [Paenibacillus sp. NEAU-GSW1]